MTIHNGRVFVDQATIQVCSGKGGDGAVSFRREKFVPKGGPDGGDGGDGGSVYVVASSGVDTLLDFAGHHHWRAEHGGPGTSKQCIGKSGDDVLIRVPVGTVIIDEESGQTVADLDCVDDRVLVAEGGKGGYGNEHYKSSTNQTPQQSKEGDPAQQRTLRLELKLVADIGLLGKPNAGKSTLLARVSRATPRIADYPFTTLEPQLGIAELSDFRRLVIADIPGLIEGAAQGQGLGIRFLRHVERTRLLLHLIEVSPIDGSDPVQNYRMICDELASYSKALAAKPQIVVISKIDLLPQESDRVELIRTIRQGLGIEPIAISSATGDQLNGLLEACWKQLKEH